VGPNHLLDRVMNCGHLWCLRGSRVSYCQVLSLARCIIDSNYATPSEMGVGLLAASKCSNYTFIMFYLYHEMDVDYLVADEIFNT
jgi:hypothetical protein